MFYIKSRPRAFNLLALWTCILFAVAAVDCRGNSDQPPISIPSPVQIITPTPTQVPNPPVPNPPEGILAPLSPDSEATTLLTPSDQFTKTLAFFLLDVSTSIQDLCEPQFQAWRADIPEFFITYAHAYHHNERGRNEEFKIGWATFPTPTGQSFDLSLESLSAFSNYTDWNGKLKNDLIPPYRYGLGFAGALDNTVEQLRGNEYNDYQKVIILISETYLDYRRDSSDEVKEEKARITQSLNNIPTDWRLFIVQLPCNQTSSDYGQASLLTDTGWWREIVKDYSHIHLLDRNNLSTLKSVADALFMHNDDQVLKSLLPWEPQAGQHGWGWIDGQNVTLENGDPAMWQTDGDTSHLNITAVAAGVNGFQLFADNEPVGNRAYPILNSNTSMLYNYSYHPQQVIDGACKNYGWRFQPETSNQNTVGIFWWQASYPALELAATIVPSITVNNPHSFSVTATLHGGDDSCYQGQLRINDQIYRNAQDRPELRNIPDLSWYDIPYDPSKLPLQFPVVVEILRRNSTIISQRPSILMLSTEQLVDINFTPVWQGSPCPTCSISNTMTTTVVSLVFDYASHYHHGVSDPLKPEVYLLTEKTRSGQIANGCNQANLGGNIFPILPNDRYMLDTPSTSLYAYEFGYSDNLQIETGSGPAFQVTITANIPEEWQHYCAYTYLLLQWPDEISQDNWHSVQCSLEDGELCVEHSDQVIHQ